MRSIWSFGLVQVVWNFLLCCYFCRTDSTEKKGLVHLSGFLVHCCFALSLNNIYECLLFCGLYTLHTHSLSILSNYFLMHLTCLYDGWNLYSFCHPLLSASLKTTKSDGFCSSILCQCVCFSILRCLYQPMMYSRNTFNHHFLV